MDELAVCGLPWDEAHPMVVTVVVAETGDVVSAKLQSASAFSASEQACVVQRVRELQFPVSSCPGNQRILVPVYAGWELD